MDYNRYARQMILPEIGEEGQKRLNAASVLIVGLGGLGSPASLYLTGAGIGRIGLCDPDVVSLSNLQRQVLYTEERIALPKTDAALERLSGLSSQTVFDLHPCGLMDENAASIIRGYDMVVDCTDNFSTRYLIDDVCAELGKPWVYGAIGAFNGQVAFMNGSHGLRYSDIYPDRESLCAQPRTMAGVLGTVPGVTGALQASEVIKAVAGFGELLDGVLLNIDFLTMQFTKVRIK